MADTPLDSDLDKSFVGDKEEILSDDDENQIDEMGNDIDDIVSEDDIEDDSDQSENEDEYEDEESKIIEDSKIDEKKDIYNSSISNLTDPPDKKLDKFNMDYNDTYISDESDDEYFEKLQHNKDFINDNHKEINNHNYKTIEKLCIITRDVNNNINDSNHRTIPILTKYEMTKIIGLRTKQLNNGCKPFIKISEDIIDGEIIAKLELQAKKIPYIIKRPISNNHFEYWRLEDLEIIY